MMAAEGVDPQGRVEVGQEGRGQSRESEHRAEAIRFATESGGSGPELPWSECIEKMAHGTNSVAHSEVTVFYKSGRSSAPSCTA